ncbi:MAG: SPFH domain-containing protein [Candidatus Aenigmatarchaeota archaeon]
MEKRWIAGIIIFLLVVGILIGIFTFEATHYSINVGQVAIVTDQVGGVIRIEKGPKWWAEKSFWESVVYYDVSVRIEDMLSPTETTPEGITRAKKEPLKGCKYGAVFIDTLDATDIATDITVHWHIDTETPGWQERIKKVYENYREFGKIEETVLKGIRDAVRNYGQKFTTDELVYKKREYFSLTVTNYAQEFLDNITTLQRVAIVDKIFIRNVVPPENVQKAYLELLAAQKEAEKILLLANATREASIRVAQGQAIAIELVVNATTEAVGKLISQNLTAAQAIQYLSLQYVYDSLKKIAEEHPEWKITLFINAPQLQYVIPITSEQP